jgi:hypothetical protein
LFCGLFFTQKKEKRGSLNVKKKNQKPLSHTSPHPLLLCTQNNLREKKNNTKLSSKTTKEPLRKMEDKKNK